MLKNKENFRLKNSLIFQSFFPLFLLLLVKYFDPLLIRLAGRFISKIFTAPGEAVACALRHDDFPSALLNAICIIGVIWGLAAGYQLRDAQTSDFRDIAYKIKITQYTTDSGVTFLATFVIPLLLDGLDTGRGVCIFAILLIMLYQLMKRTNLYYQNPMLTIWGYRTFEFRFVKADHEMEYAEEEKLIGITKGTLREDRIVKWQHISDNVYLLYNKNPGEEKNVGR